MTGSLVDEEEQAVCSTTFPRTPRRSPQPSPRSLWELDCSTHTCRRCHVRFHFFKRRHHCRFCGLVVCGRCTPRHHRYNGQRQCNACYQKWEADKELALHADLLFLSYITQPDQSSEFSGTSSYAKEPGENISPIFLRPLQTQRNASPYRKPCHKSLWEPDSATPTCRRCRAWFHFFNRRHHCRFCGLVVCGRCTPKHQWYEAQRRCITCYQVSSRTANKST